jgi:hypothetical protein
MKKLAVLLAIAVSLVGCSRVETGSVGILKHWGGEISTEPQTGVVLTIFDSMITEVDTTETRITLPNLRPSDSNGVLLDELGITMSFRMEPSKVPSFYIQTKELSTYRDDAGRTIETVGLKVLENIVQHSIQEETKKASLMVLAANLGEYENAILARSQAELDKGYPGVFHMIRINVNQFTPPKSILDQANAVASLKGEANRIDQEQTLIAKRTALETAKALVEARALADAAHETHLTPEQLIAWRNARAYETQAVAIATQATKTLDVGKQPK